MRTTPRSLALLALGLLGSACMQLNQTGTGPKQDAATTPGADGNPGPTPDARRDQAPPADSGGGDTSSPAPDVMPTECTPNERSCAPDGQVPRTCSAQGRWQPGPACPAQTTCNAGACVCPGNCGGDVPLFTVTGWVPFPTGLVGGGRYLYLAVSGPAGSVRRLDLDTKAETTVAGPELGTFAVGSDAMGTALWCNQLGTGAAATGRVVHGTTQLAPGPCTPVRQRDGLVYYLGDLLYRKALDATPRQPVTTEPMNGFELGGDHLYFVTMTDDDLTLKRLPLAEPFKVEMLVQRADSPVLDMVVDRSHVYLSAGGEILRVPVTGAAQPEVFWKDTSESWGMAQTDTHVYWAASIPSPVGCDRTQIFRRAKTGGQATPLALISNHCAGPLLLLDGQLYAVAWVGGNSAVPTKVFRIRP